VVAGYLIGTLLFHALNTRGRLVGEHFRQAVVAGLPFAALMTAYTRGQARRRATGRAAARGGGAVDGVRGAGAVPPRARPSATSRSVA
jgi:hypothetical protein